MEPNQRLLSRNKDAQLRAWPNVYFLGLWQYSIALTIIYDDGQVIVHDVRPLESLRALNDATAPPFFQGSTCMMVIVDHHVRGYPSLFKTSVPPRVPLQDVRPRRKPPEVKLLPFLREDARPPRPPSLMKQVRFLLSFFQKGHPPARGEACSLPSGGRASSRRKGTSSLPEGRASFGKLHLWREGRPSRPSLTSLPSESGERTS